MVGQLADPLDDEVRGQQAVAPGAGAVPRAAERLALPAGELVEVLAPVVERRRRDEGGEAGQHVLRVADDRHLDGDVLADLGRVDVDVDDPRVRRVGPDVAGDPVVEAHADRDQQVGRLDRAVDVLPAVHAHVAVRERMPLVDGADAEQRPGDRDARLLGEGAQLVARRRRSARRDRRGSAAAWRAAISRAADLELLGVALDGGPEAGQAGDDVVEGRVLGAGLLLQGVLGDVDVDGPGAAGAREVERLGDDARDVVGVADQVVVLGHRQRDAGDVDLLEGVLADQRAGHVAGDRDHRDRVQLGGGDRR